MAAIRTIAAIEGARLPVARLCESQMAAGRTPRSLDENLIDNPSRQRPNIGDKT
jgi:hypothetical protein